MKYVLLILIVMVISVNTFAYDSSSKITEHEIIEKLATLEQGQKDFKEIMNQRFEAVGQRIDDMNNRFSDLQNTMRMVFSLIIVVNLGVFGFILWDRRTMMKPMERSIRSVEMELGIGEPDGSKVHRIIESFRQLAKTNPEVANVLKSYHLL